MAAAGAGHGARQAAALTTAAPEGAPLLELLSARKAQRNPGRSANKLLATAERRTVPGRGGG
jgi:hypothetical protein